MKATFCRVMSLARVACLLAGLQLLGLLLLAGSAQAAVHEALNQASAWLLELHDTRVNEPTDLWINGQRIGLVSGTSELTPSELLDRFEEYCSGRTNIALAPEAIASALAQEASSGAIATTAWLLSPRGVFRSSQGSRGIVACLDAHSSKAGESSLLERGARFLNSGDLATLGDMRYFLVLGDEDGRTLFLSAWTSGEFKILSMFPLHGDAPGADLPGVPRPEHSERSLSAGTVGSGRVVSYRRGAPPLAALAAYQAQLQAGGWTARPVAGSPQSILVRRASRTVLVTCGGGPDDNSSQITLTEI